MRHATCFQILLKGEGILLLWDPLDFKKILTSKRLTSRNVIFFNFVVTKFNLVKKTMNNLSKKNILIIIPKSQFCEQELNGVRTVLQQVGANVIVL